MTPKPEEKGSVLHSPKVRTPQDGETVVISGMAGLYPKARYVRDLEHILYNKINPISSEGKRWTFNHPEAAQFIGNVPDLDRFDAQFFKVHSRLGYNMDSMSRKLLEQTYEAIYDAGLSPEHLMGKRIGVYVGTCFSETEKAVFYDAGNTRGFGLTGCSKAMFANRISYWLNAKGPSVSIDQACCSSSAALEAAFKSISQGDCDAAIVGGANLCIHPQYSVQYGRIMNISKDGKMKSFAEDADGCINSEAISVLVLQKAKDAKRRYADVIHVRSEYLSIINEESGPKYGFYRHSEDVTKFLNAFYEDAGVPAAAVDYVEAVGSAVLEADKSELETIDEVFCRKRNSPLLLGSISSNIGYGESASGLSSVVKVLLGYHKGSLAGNLHYTQPRRDVSAIQDGRIRVLSDHHPLQRSAYTAVNNMSVTGVNAHVLLKGYNKLKDLSRFKSSIPRLVTLSGRHEDAAKRAIDILKSEPIDPEQIALLHNIHEKNITGHLGRGYIILDTNAEGETCSLSEQVLHSDAAKRPLWFVYSGMGSQWMGMGKQLMRIPIFAAAIERCHKVLEPKGLDLVNILTSSDKTIFDNILHSFVGIAAVQIGLTDILFALGLEPDNIIGHSVGELGCAYADGCLTAEEMILCAYSRGGVSLETPFIRGSMAAIGLGAKEISPMCPPEIQIACHNSAQSCTISGPAEVMKEFVADLSSRKIFAREVPCSNIAYHSKYIAEAGPTLQKYLKEVIKTPKLRSERWVSTSVPQDRWNEPNAKYCSAEYQTNNLLSPVLFEETSELIPPNALLVEVAPHGLLQAILKRALPDSTVNIPLTRRGDSDSVLTLLNAIGKIYLHGFNPQVKVLSPEVQFPVSTGTPFLSHFVQWYHEEKWSLPLYQTACRTTTANYTVTTSVHDDDYYLQGNVIGNKRLLPFSFALVAVWDLLAMTLGVPKKSINVRFRDIKLYAQPIVHDQKVVSFNISLHRGSGSFEIMEEHSKIATGYISVAEKKLITGDNATRRNNSETDLNVHDVYKILYQRGYAYSGEFRSIYNTDASITNAKILWKNNWVTFIDGLIQLNALKYTHNGIVQPDKIRSLLIDVNTHFQSVHEREAECVSKSGMSAYLSEVVKRTSCGGVVMENITFCSVIHANKVPVSLQTLKFIPRYHTSNDITVSTSLRILLQIAAENLNNNFVNVLGLKTDNSKNELFEEMKLIAESGIPKINIQYKEKSVEAIFTNNEEEFKSVDVILIRNLSNYEKLIHKFQDLEKYHTFVINEEAITSGLNNAAYKEKKIVSVIKNDKAQLELLIWKPIVTAELTKTYSVTSEQDLNTLQQLYSENTDNTRNGILIVTSYPPVKGLMTFVKSWKKEHTRNNISVFIINDQYKDNITIETCPNYNLAFNIFNDNVWGGEYYLPVEDNTAIAPKINVTLQNKEVGNFNTLHWAQATELPKAGTITVLVSHIGINMGDVRKALGLTSHFSKIYDGYGMDFSGVTKSNERVMGVAPNGAASKYVSAQPELLWPVPEYWTLEDAATVPFAYIYAYYCLFMKTTRVFEEEEYSVLVHGGTGALGLAAINIALARGWRVFATVRDTRKKRLLMKLFPQLNENYIGNSRDIGFKDMVLNATNGEGCNLILCSLKGELKDASLSCCKFSGTVLDTTQIISNENYTYGMFSMTKSRSYITVDIRSIFEDLNSKEIKILHSMISEGIASGEVRPLTRITFEHFEAARAYRLLAASHHCGRVLLRVADQPSSIISTPSSTEIACHVIICGTSPLGLQAVDKLIEFGAQKLHVHVNGPIATYLKYKQRIWNQQNVEVTTSNGTLTSLKDVERMLSEVLELGAVEGLHVVADDGGMETVIDAVDSVSRSLYPSLKHFVMLSNDTNNGYNICVQRAKNGLPATFLDISLLKTHQDADGEVWYRGVSEAVDLMRRREDTVLLAVPESKPDRTSLVQKLAALTGLHISPDTPTTDSLEQLGLSEERISAVWVFLRDAYNTALDEHSIPRLTIERLQAIEERMNDVQFKEVKGLNIFYSAVQHDELRATIDMEFLSTLSNNNAMRDDEFDMNGTYLIIVSGLEGLHERFSKICQRLKLSAFVLQPGFDHPEETLQELAQRYCEILRKKIVLKNKFYIMGYETGVAVALELTHLLEKQGLTGTMFALGDGPSETLALLESTLAEFPTEAALQEAIILHMFKLMALTTDTANLEIALKRSSSWKERKNECVRLLLGRVPHSAQYTHSLLESSYLRLQAARHFIPQPQKLRSRVVLLRSSPMPELINSCSLKNYSDQLIVHEINTPMAHITNDLRVSSFINSHLDEEVIQDFQNKNLCDAQLTNADAFVTVDTNQ